MMIGLTESDIFALSMFGVILLSFGVLLMLGFCMFRNASRRDGDVDRLLDEVAEDERATTVEKNPVGEMKSELWEKDGDWWKQ